jgi:hypothetical protein
VSKKVVTFKMPARGVNRSEGADRSPNEETTSPIGRLADAATGTVGTSDQDQWVRNRAAEQESAPAPQKREPARTSLTIDLAAERNFAEIVTLALSVPPLLGWFWFFNAMGRYWASSSR